MNPTILLSGEMVSRLIRQLGLGIALAALIGPYDLLSWLSAGLVIIGLTTIPTSQKVFCAFGAKILGIVAMTAFAALLLAVMLWIVDPIYRLNLSIMSRVVIFAAICTALFISGWFKQRRRGMNE